MRSGRGYSGRGYPDGSGLNPKWLGVACIMLMIFALAGLLVGAAAR